MTVFSESGFFVESNQGGDWIVFRPSASGTHAVSDSAYAAGIDGLSCAIARAMYLSRGPGRHASEALALAESYMAKAKSHGAEMRAALADFDAEFLA